jgi:hypothetical protein
MVIKAGNYSAPDIPMEANVGSFPVLFPPLILPP